MVLVWKLSLVQRAASDRSSTGLTRINEISSLCSAAVYLAAIDRPRQAVEGTRSNERRQKESDGHDD
jgi:hypothetical protein